MGVIVGVSLAAVGAAAVAAGVYVLVGLGFGLVVAGAELAAAGLFFDFAKVTR